LDEIKIKECIQMLFEYIAEEEKNESKELVARCVEKLKSLKTDFADPEYFNLFLVRKLNEGAVEIAKTMHNMPATEIKDTCKPNFIYVNYGFLEHNIRELCVLREGNTCCADKSRSILEMYLNYSLTGKLPEFNPNEEKYWIPNFGTYKEWIDLCDGLYNLYYGETKKYFTAYNTLIHSEIRRYRHILHTWYIKFKDGQIVKFNTTWDKDTENPLDNECFDKGDYYLIGSRRVKNRKYEIVLISKIFKYFKVPKSDIEKIYKDSKEKIM
jgi:hypothetical protein